MPTNYIKRIGVEMEGGWRSRPSIELRRDGSVEVRADYVGEVSSPPYFKPDNVELWIRKHHPHIVNSSCGFHVHISVEPGHYSMLMCREFYDAYLRAYRQWGETSFSNPGLVASNDAARFYERLNGGNRYCQGRWDPDTQTLATNRQNPAWDSRYSHLNFCWSLHGTLESRLLPMFGLADYTTSSMRVFLNVVNEWLESMNAAPPPPMESSLIEEAELGLGGEVVKLPDAILVETPPAATITRPANYGEFLRNLMPNVFSALSDDQPPTPEPPAGNDDYTTESNPPPRRPSLREALRRTPSNTSNF